MAFVLKIFSLFNIGHESLDKAMTALASDAQQGTCLSIDFLKVNRKTGYVKDFEMRFFLFSPCFEIEFLMSIQSVTGKESELFVTT